GVAGLELPEDARNPANVLLLGMGGSAIGGDLARDIVADTCPVPFQVNRDYDLPAWVDRRTLVIASSYSGNTEETLSGLEQAIDRVVAENRPEVPAAQNPAKKLAQGLFGRVAVIYGGGLLANVARRWKTQINENSKGWAFYEECPELCHNAVLGYQFPHFGDR